MGKGFALPAAHAVAATIFFTAAAGAAYAQAAPQCQTPNDIIRLAYPLSHVAMKLATGAPITVVAIGSSSTAGAGASTAAASYPSRLQVFLSEKFPQQKFKVINRGTNGEEVKDMLRRFDTAVLSEKPDLVLWQLGTNSVIRDVPLGDHGAQIRTGLEMLKRAGADVVLIDPQFAPKVNMKPEAKTMVRLISETAKAENVDLFHRFDLMQHWHDIGLLSFDTFVSPDGLHMNDWSYGCLAKGLANAIAEAATRPVASATVSPAMAASASAMVHFAPF